jgi:hypothetical protein
MSENKRQKGAMKFQVVRFKSLRSALNEIAKFVSEARQLQTGMPLKRFGGLRPRELLANWLVCAAFNEHCGSPDRLTPSNMLIEETRGVADVAFGYFQTSPPK